MTLDQAIAAMLDQSDLIMVGGKTWLLAPVSTEQIDALAAHGAGVADLEPGGDREPADAAGIEDMDRLTAATAERRAHKHGAVA